MPYEICFQRRFKVPNPSIYINDCCWGGDIVVERLLPTIRFIYQDVQSNQEDWGWFIWFRRGAVHFAIDVFTDLPKKGAFRIHITARRKRWLFFDSMIDGPELEAVMALVLSNLEDWSKSPVKVAHLDAR